VKVAFFRPGVGLAVKVKAGWGGEGARVYNFLGILKKVLLLINLLDRVIIT
jgi:hypothetical protein